MSCVFVVLLCCFSITWPIVSNRINSASGAGVAAWAAAVCCTSERGTMFNLLPKDTVFFDLFEQLAGHAVTSAKHLHAMAEAFPNAETPVQLIRQAEHEADDLAHQALDRL